MGSTRPRLSASDSSCCTSFDGSPSSVGQLAVAKNETVVLDEIHADECLFDEQPIGFV